MGGRRLLSGSSGGETSRIAVKAYYVARSIDVSRLYEGADPGVLRQHRVGRESVMLTLSSPSAAVDSSVDSTSIDKLDDTLSPWRGHVVVFSYGSIVFFNVSLAAQRECLKLVVPYCNETIPEGFQPTEDYSVIQRADFSASTASTLSSTKKMKKIKSNQHIATQTATSRAAATRREPAGTLRAAATRREPSALLSSSIASTKVVRRRRDGLFVYAPPAIDPQVTAVLRLSHQLGLVDDIQSSTRQNDSFQQQQSPLEDDDETHQQEKLHDDEPATQEQSTTKIGFDAVILPRLDVHNVSVIATVMAQTVALDHYSVKVDAMLATFSRLNSKVEKTGVFNSLEKHNLFKLVALNNTLFTDVIAKIGLLERSETAWRSLEYTQIWEGLRDEFEVEDRFEKIEFKLNLVQLNTKFFLEILANQKSNTLEWIIIVLISLEIVVGSCDLCGIRPFDNDGHAASSAAAASV